MITAQAIDGLPEITPQADLAALIWEALPCPLEPGDIVVIAHKAVSKAEGRLRAIDQIDASPQAQQLAKDPRHVQAVLDETQRILRAERGVMICLTHRGFVCANAGVDASNAPPGMLVLHPSDPDESARRLRARLSELTGIAPGILITDTFGRAWRLGQTDTAIGCAGLTPLEDWRGRVDSDGRTLNATWIAIADELAAAADLARAKDSAQPAVLIRGAGRHVTVEDGPGATALLRPEAQDMFR